MVRVISDVLNRQGTIEVVHARAHEWFTEDEEWTIKPYVPPKLDHQQIEDGEDTLEEVEL